MKVFLRKIFVLASAILFVGLAVEAFIFVQMEGRCAHVLEDWHDLIDLETDFVFVGNSRTAGHVIPRRIEQHGLRGYNIAYDGFPSQMGADRLDFLLKNAVPPKFVFVQTDLSFLSGDGKLENFPMKDGMLRFFYLDQLGINDYFREYNNWREADTYVPLLRYKGYPLIFFKHLVGWNRWNKKEKLGFWHTDKEVGFQLESVSDVLPNQLSLCGIDSICNAHNIELIGVTPPSPKSIYKPSSEAFRTLPSHMEVWDFSALFDTCEAEYFYDKAHFNLRGAEIYSDSIAARFKSKLNSN